MAGKYFFKSNGSKIISVADAEYFTDEMDSGYSIGVIAVEFLDDDGVTVVTPTGGTVTFSSSPIDGQWHQPSNGNGTISAVDVKPEANYTMPTFDGPVLKSRMVLSGITGATFVRAYHWRDE